MVPRAARAARPAAEVAHPRGRAHERRRAGRGREAARRAAVAARLAHARLAHEVRSAGVADRAAQRAAIPRSAREYAEEIAADPARSAGAAGRLPPDPAAEPGEAPRVARRRRSLEEAESLAPAERARADRLRAWRQSWAKANDLPAFLVFHDQTLYALAQSRPTTLDALLGVPGIGPHKVEQFGDALLRALAEEAAPGG